MEGSKNKKEEIYIKLFSIINYKNLMKFKKKLDPRIYNGAILLGLNSPVIKSHGSTDFIGFYNSWENGITHEHRAEGTMSVYMTYAGLLMMALLIASGKLIFAP